MTVYFAPDRNNYNIWTGINGSGKGGVLDLVNTYLLQPMIERSQRAAEVNAGRKAASDIYDLWSSNQDMSPDEFAMKAQALPSYAKSPEMAQRILETGKTGLTRRFLTGNFDPNAEQQQVNNRQLTATSPSPDSMTDNSMTMPTAGLTPGQAQAAALNRGSNDWHDAGNAFGPLQAANSLAVKNNGKQVATQDSGERTADVLNQITQNAAAQQAAGNPMAAKLQRAMLVGMYGKDSGMDSPTIQTAMGMTYPKAAVQNTNLGDVNTTMFYDPYTGEQTGPMVTQQYGTSPGEDLNAQIDREANAQRAKEFEETRQDNKDMLASYGVGKVGGRTVRAGGGGGTRSTGTSGGGRQSSQNWRYMKTGDGRVVMYDTKSGATKETPFGGDSSGKVMKEYKFYQDKLDYFNKKRSAAINKKLSPEDAAQEQIYLKKLDGLAAANGWIEKPQDGSIPPDTLPPSDGEAPAKSKPINNRANEYMNIAKSLLAKHKGDIKAAEAEINEMNWTDNEDAKGEAIRILHAVGGK